MITGTVKGSELDPKKGLRAEDYLFNAKAEAKDLVRTWLRANGLDKLFRANSPYLNQLEVVVYHALQAAYERGQKQGQPEPCIHCLDLEGEIVCSYCGKGGRGVESTRRSPTWRRRASDG